MTKCPKPLRSTADLAIGVVTIDVAAASAEAGAASYPEWIKIAPRGAVTCRDGRGFSFNPERLVARFDAEGVDLPIDIDHAITRKVASGDRADAHAWIKALQARPDGIYARTEWLASGKAALDGKTHRYVSPTFKHTDAGEATWLHSVSLVAAPALAMPALASALAGSLFGEPHRETRHPRRRARPRRKRDGSRLPRRPRNPARRGRAARRA